MQTTFNFLYYSSRCVFASTFLGKPLSKRTDTHVHSGSQILPRLMHPSPELERRVSLFTRIYCVQYLSYGAVSHHLPTEHVFRILEFVVRLPKNSAVSSLFVAKVLDVASDTTQSKIIKRMLYHQPTFLQY